jgi:Selenoprotein, putative
MQGESSLLLADRGEAHRLDAHGLKAAVRHGRRGIWWYLKHATGEAKWDEYLQRAGSEGFEPMSCRDFERHRSEHQEMNPQARCC